MSGSTFWVFALASAALLAAAAFAISKALERASSRRQLVESFAGGVSLSFVTLDLLVELVAGSGDEARHLGVRGGEPFETIALLLLAGIVVTFITDVVASRRASERIGYLATFLPRVAYGAIVGAALVQEAHEARLGFALFWLAMALHLGVSDHFLRTTFPSRHGARSRWAFAAALVCGAVLWLLLEPIEGVFHALLALVGGATLLGAFREEIPNAKEVRLLAFFAGVLAFGSLAWLRWHY